MLSNQYQSIVKSSKSVAVNLVKFKADKQQVFGWACVAEDWTKVGNRWELKPLIDWQQDIVSSDFMEDMAYKYVISYRDSGEMHVSSGVATCIESMAFTLEKQKLLGIPPGIVPVGWWIGLHVTDPIVWAKIKEGKLKAFSIEGSAVRENVQVDATKYRVAKRCIEKHNPYHDARGRFTSANGGASGMPSINIAAFAEPGQSLSQHLVNGKLTPERAAIHKNIIKSFFSKDLTKPAQPQVTIMAGGPGAGKTHILKTHNIDTSNTVTIDPDKIKTMLPEFQEQVSKGNRSASAFVHEESSYLSAMVRQVALQKGYNILHDSTGGSSAEKITKSAAEYREKGYNVKAIYVTVDTKTALQRAEDRGNRTGRHVPTEVVTSTHQRVSRLFPVALKTYDSIDVYDTSGGGNKKIFTKTPNSVKVLDRKAYKAFLDKGD